MLQIGLDYSGTDFQLVKKPVSAVQNLHFIWVSYGSVIIIFPLWAMFQHHFSG